MNSRQETGRLGELAARRHLAATGCAIIGTNVRCGRSEIDIVAQDGDTLVFVEVRTRRGHQAGTPEESVTPRKQQQMLTAAQRYLTETNGWQRNWRIDVVSVQLDHLNRVASLRVVRNAIEL
ncbi:MAG: YraN family protein [Chloroflexota bacterium]|nr:YraN family protein [Chloroflexota bacterium]